MALVAKVVTCTLSGTDTGTVDATISGFGTPTAAIVFVSNANTSSNPQVSSVLAAGFWDGTNQYSIGALSEDSVTTSDTYRDADLDSVLCAPNISGTDYFQYSISNITDGVRLTKQSGTTSAQRYATVILLKGTSNVYVGVQDLGTGTSAINVTAPGFRADAVITLCAGIGSQAITAGAYFALGAARIAANDTVIQGFAAVQSDDAVADTATFSYISDGEASGQLTSWQATIGANASGFSITPNANAGSDDVYYLALEFPNGPDDFYVGIVDSKTSTGTQAYTGTGFTPQVLFLAQTVCTAVDTSTEQGFLALGATDGTRTRVVDYYDTDALATTDANSSSQDTNILHIKTDDGTTESVAALSSFDSNGWTLNYSDGSSTARKVLAIAFGDGVSTGAQTLTPSLVTNSQTFHAPTVTTGSATLAPSLVTNSQTFHAATVSTGSVTLEPSLVTNGQTFYAPVVSNGGVTLAPSLVTNSQTFPSPTISVGAVTLTLDVVVNGQTFYAPTVAQPSGQTLEPTLVTNGQMFYGPTVEGMLLTQADLDAIAAAVWADPAAVAAHAKLDAIIARITC